MKKHFWWIPLTAVIFFWLIDTLVYGWFFKPDGFMDVLLFRLPPYEIFLRIVGFLLIAGIAGLLLQFYLKNRLHTEAMQTARKMVREREEQLQSLNEQLQAANQQLKANMQQLNAANQQLRAEEQQLKAMNQELAENEKELLNSRGMLRLVMDAIPVRVFWKNLDSVYMGCNHMFARDAGLADPLDIVGLTDADLPWSALAELCRSYDREVIETKSPKFEFEVEHPLPGRTMACLCTSKIPLQDQDGNITGVLGVYEDITERKKSEDRIRASLKEKEVLLKEIHHRVKNNLQVISSLLNLQSAYVADQRDLRLFQESQERVRAMALVHEKLYQSADLAHVNFKEYAQNMINELSQLHQRPDITLQIEIAPAMLTVEKAIPCGLIMHELITNAMLYAFPASKTIAEAEAARTRNKISIAFKEHDSDNWLIRVMDNGRGLPPDVDIDQPKTMGLQLVNILTRQLRGRLALRRDESTEFQIILPR